MLIFCLLVLLVIERGVLTSPTIMVHVCISLFTSVLFHFVYFEVATTAPVGAGLQVKAVRENKKKKEGEGEGEKETAVCACGGHCPGFHPLSPVCLLMFTLGILRKLLFIFCPEF